jgi:protein-L-isoaspartate O-methyltransferase
MSVTERSISPALRRSNSRLELTLRQSDNTARTIMLRILIFRLSVLVLLFSAAALAQKPEYDFYPAFRNNFTPKMRAENLLRQLSNDEIVTMYAAKLKSEGFADQEITRRTTLLRTQRPALEADYWNRFYTNANSNFNKAPNVFLMDTVKMLRPGVALDYGMGEGRNSIYLASLGWEVWGFDPADAGIALAQKRARSLGLTLHTSAVRDSDYDFGKNRFDLIVFSWTMPLVPMKRVVESLKPGGMIVMECGADFVGRNEMLRIFDPLLITHYDVVRAKSDFYDRRETDVLRLIARKPKE